MEGEGQTDEAVPGEEEVTPALAAGTVWRYRVILTE